MSKLMQSAIRWMLHDKLNVTVEGEGYVETFAWETEPGYAVHILNYNNPNMARAPIRATFPIGEQRVAIELLEGTNIKKIALLRSGKEIAFKRVGNKVSFTVPSVQDFEIAALYKS